MKKTKIAPKRKNKKKKQELAGTRVKLTFKKHLVPPLAGLMVAVLVFGFFNSSLLSARIAYYIQQHHPKTYASTTQVAGTPIDKDAHSIKIEKINVDAPVIYDQNVVNESAFLLALHNGVVHYPNTALPGQQGNVVIFGHSSGQWWAPGNYKFVFTLLDKVVIGDRIFLDYQGKRYIYKVYNTQIVQPTDLSVLNQGSSNILTLITCTPVGTSAKRLIVRAQQIVPKVGSSTSSTKPATLPDQAQGNLPGSSGSFWSDLKNLF
jgi:LPXTG-site transpeptidase (sortase) family protein